MHSEPILFAESQGEAVGVTAAWVPGPSMPSSCGRIHWVAVRPSHQRRAASAGRWCWPPCSACAGWATTQPT